MFNSNILTESDYNLLQRLMTGSLAYTEFEELFSEKVNLVFVLNTMALAKCLDDAGMYRNVLFGFGSLLNNIEKLSLYRISILESFHEEHEEIISAFQVTFNSESENIKYIEFAIENIPDYLKREELKDSYIRKCMYALAAQPTPKSIESLKKMSSSDNEIIKKYAVHQLEKKV